MNKVLEKVRCINCGDAIPAGELVCPYCFPSPGSPARKLAPLQRSQEPVPVKLALPANMGGMEAKVSQGTANSIACTVTGGLLVALGVIVPAILGLRARKS